MKPSISCSQFYTHTTHTHTQLHTLHYSETTHDRNGLRMILIAVKSLKMGCIE